MEKSHMDATATTRCKLKMVKDVYEKLDLHHKNKLEDSCFGSLLRLRDIKLASQVVHQLLLRVVNTSKKKEAWFKIGEKRARFGIEEFVLVTGLNVGGTTHVDKTLGAECRIVKEYFKKSKGKITKWDVYSAFLSCKKRKSDKYKLGLLVILAYVLWAPEANTYMDLWWFELVDDLNRFEKYPWGKLCFECTINVFKREMGSKVKNSDVGGETHLRYSLHGFPLAIMIWAFEAIPSLGMKFAKKHEDATPRMVAWTLSKRLTSIVVDNALQSRELEVKSRLVPSEAEMEETYWKELTVDEEEDENDPHQSEGDEPEQVEEQHSPRPSQPPPVPHDLNLANLIRTEMEKVEGRLLGEMEKVEGRLLGVLTARLDSMERKIDRFIELAAKSRSHSSPTAFEGGTSSAAYVPSGDMMDDKGTEMTEKEVGEKIEKGEQVDVEGEEGEKETSFQTPEAREGDATQSSVGESVKIQEVGSELPKGRGQRTKRKPIYLCSPFTDPTKRRKLEAVDKFDPYRDVDPSKLESLDRWLEVLPSSQLIPLHCTNVSAMNLMKLLDEDGWLTGNIIEEALYQIRERATKYPNVFQQNYSILDTYFYRFIWNAHEEMSHKKEFKCSKSLLNYVLGTAPELGKLWEDCKHLYLPCNTENHWFALQIDLEQRTIFMFDSLKGHVRRAALERYILPLQEVIPFMIKFHVTSDENYSTEKFNFVKVDKVPQQRNGADCGILTLKYIEFLQAKMDVNEIRTAYIPMWRKKLAAELLAWNFEP